LRRLPTRAAIYKAARTVARPPQIARLPRTVPLSRLIGASPTNAAICLRLMVPSSGKSAQQGDADDRANAFHTAEHILLLAPERAGPDGLAELLVDAFQAFAQPRDVRLDVGADGCRCGPAAVLLSGEHLDQLAAACYQGTQCPRGGIRQWPHRVGKVGEHAGVDGVGFGQLAGRSLWRSRVPGVG
jgi:hypothetical protein